MKARKNINPNRKKYLYLGGLGILLVSGVSYWYFFGREKLSEANENNSNEDLPPVKDSLAPKTAPKPKITSPKANAPVTKKEEGTSSNSEETEIVLPSEKEYPIKKGSKKIFILQLQQALIKHYGKDILKKYGADGDFGTETQNALSVKGFPVVIDEANYKKIIALAYPVPAPSDGISPSDRENIDIAKNIWVSAATKKLNPLLDHLKRIKNVAQYVKVNELFKTIRLGGVRQTIVNGSLSSFSDATSKQFITEALRGIGLKYYDEKWNLSGVDERKIITNQETTICRIDGSGNMRVPYQTVLGIEVFKGRHSTRFRALDNQILYVPTKHIRYV